MQINVMPRSFCALFIMSASPLAAAPLENAALTEAPEQMPDTEKDTPASDDQADESAPALALEAAYVVDVAGVVSGGIDRDIRYIDNLDLVASADFEQLLGWRGASAEVYALYNNGASLSDVAGDAQTISNIETGTRAVRLYTAWLEQEVTAETSIKLGLYDINSEFDALDSAGLFTQSAHGIGTDIAQSGRNGPSIFPIASLAGRFSASLGDGWHFRTAIADGVPGDPSRPARTAIKLGNGDGAFVIGELEIPLPRGKMLLGHWHYTDDEELIEGGSGRANHGIYFRGETQIHRLDGHPEKSINLFWRFGIAEDRFNPFGTFLGGGVTLKGVLFGRDADQFGLAFATAIASDASRALNPDLTHETAIEVSYRAEICDWLTIQPHAHWVINPSSDPRNNDALVFAIRFELGHYFFGR